MNVCARQQSNENKRKVTHNERRFGVVGLCLLSVVVILNGLAYFGVSYFMVQEKNDGPSAPGVGKETKGFAWAILGYLVVFDILLLCIWFSARKMANKASSEKKGFSNVEQYEVMMNKLFPFGLASGFLSSILVWLILEAHNALNKPPFFVDSIWAFFTNTACFSLFTVALIWLYIQ